MGQFRRAFPDLRITTSFFNTPNPTLYTPLIFFIPNFVLYRCSTMANITLR